MSSFIENLPKRIKQARLEAGLTAADLAQRLHLSGCVTIARYESGQRHVSLEMLEQIAKATGKHIMWFLINREEEGSAESEGIDEEQLMSIFRSLKGNAKAQLLDYANYLYTRYPKIQELHSVQHQTKAADSPQSYS